MTIIKQGDEYLYTREDGHTDRSGVIVAYPPQLLLTDGGGDNARLRVDVAQTGFFDGREFRTFRRITTASGATRVFKAVVPINVILFDLRIMLTDGWIDLETRIGGTEGGTFAEVLPIIPRNSMTTAPVYSPVVAITTGGTHTGGTVLDVFAVRTANATAQASSVGGGISDERGISAGTYYFVMTNLGSGAASGVFSARWEERP